MARSLGNLWLKSLQRIGRAQQKKLVKSFAVATRKAAKKAVKTVKKKPVAKAKAQPKAAVVLPALPGTWMRSFFASPDGRRMSYWLYLPQRGKASASKPMPLVVMLHGCTQTAPEFAQGTNMNALAQRKGFAVLYPQQLLSIDANRCWRWYQRSTQQGGGEAALVAGMLTEVVSRHALDASRVYLAGMSAGAALAHIIALRYPHYIAAVGMHSGPVFGSADNRISAFASMQTGGGLGLAQAVHAVGDVRDFPRMPAILLHGEADKVVRIASLHQVAQQFRLVNGLTDAVPVTHNSPVRPGGRSPRHAFQLQDYRVGRKPIVSVYRIAGLEHAWSGGDDTLRFNSKMGPDASALLWAFFARHRRLRRV